MVTSVYNVITTHIQIGLLHTLTYTSKLTVRGGVERNFTIKEMISISHCERSIYM